MVLFKWRSTENLPAWMDSPPMEILIKQVTKNKDLFWKILVKLTETFYNK